MKTRTPEVNDSPGLDSEILTVEDLAKILKVHRNTVYRLVDAGQIPGAAYFGSTIRIHGPTVVAWMRSGQKHVSRDARRRAAR